jgi:Flp pilus assembly pilin Flp
MRLRLGLLSWAKDEDGSHTLEMALGVALFSLIAGFGFFAFGDALAEFFVRIGNEFRNAALAIPGFGGNP